MYSDGFEAVLMTAMQADTMPKNKLTAMQAIVAMYNSWNVERRRFVKIEMWLDDTRVFFSLLGRLSNIFVWSNNKQDYAYTSRFALANSWPDS